MMWFIRKTDELIKVLFPDYYQRLKAQRWLMRVYYNTAHWERIRERVLKRDRYQCQHCGRTESVLQVHHNTYAYLFFEHNHLSTLTTLCKRCHRVADRIRKDRIRQSFR